MLRWKTKVQTFSKEVLFNNGKNIKRKVKNNQITLSGFFSVFLAEVYRTFSTDQNLVINSEEKSADMEN